MDGLLAAAALFVAAVATAGLLLFPPRPGDAARLRRSSQPRPGVSVLFGDTTTRLRSVLLRSWLPCVIVLFLAAPSVSLFILHPQPALHAFGQTADARAIERITALLQGPRLAAPQPLPPALFLTEALVEALPEVASADRDWSRLDADFRQRLLVVHRLMREQYGYDMVLLEGYRSPQRQERLAAQGPATTRARAGQSQHQFGLAADCAFLRDGAIVIAESDPWAMRGYALYGQLAEQAGLTWGGAWRMRDFGHVELRR